MKQVKNHSCVFSSLVFAGISFSLHNTPISLEISVVLVMQVAAGGSHSVGFGILTFLLYPPGHCHTCFSFAGLFLWSQGSISNTPGAHEAPVSVSTESL